MTLKLSILDLSPLYDSETAAQAFQRTIELARKAEAWGYHRFWVSEHHGSDRVVGSSPEVLISHLLAKTERIRVGSGGVMLQHYSPYKVVENFNVLASLAPGRVDLGIGRGPGGMPQSTRALQQGDGSVSRPLSDKLVELEQLLHNRVAANHPLHGLRASPKPPEPAELFLLGTSPASAELAADMAIPYVFAYFLNSDDAAMREAVAAYRARFAAAGARPQVMLALPVIVADTDTEASTHAAQITVVRIRLQSGRTLTVGNLEGAEEFGRQAGEAYTLEVQQARVIHGAPDTVRQQLVDLQQAYEIDELMVITAIKDFGKRLHSYALLSELFSCAAPV
ncbi:MAG: LLM class flavin-dependent oxidoreductase [Candidatus Tectomicrobia bacterium]|nr:LLM class flavin-dependent oxidoreductase [Candidatus Tectomicrobia bacterium]